MKRFALTLMALGSLLAPASAGADGLPLPVDGSDHATVTTPDEPFRYGAVSSGGETTLVKIATDGGQIVNSRGMDGTFRVPVVAYDGTASGLSADGSTLALIQPRRAFPRETTTFRIADTTSLRTNGTIELDGDFSFDAISPDGRRLYLIHYQSPRNPLDYEVVAYDVVRGKLLRKPIVDPDEPEERMAGFPLARHMSPDGRWAYTLYGGGHETFIHALDTQGLTAQCIDIEGVDPTDISRLGLNMDPGSGELTVLNRAEPVALVDPRTFEVSEPAPPGPAAEASADDDGSSWIGWAAVGGGLALVAALALMLRRRREPAESVDEQALEDLVRVDAEEREREPVP